MTDPDHGARAFAAPARVDVCIVGFGPTAQVAANLLVQAGVAVLCLEREPAPFGFARAAATDDEVLRILQRTGVRLGDRVLPGAALLVGRGGRELPLLVPRSRPNGHPRLAFFHQPALEAALIARLPPGVVRHGAAYAGHVEDADGVTVRTADGAPPVRARYLLACDGARSAVRAACGIAFAGRTAPRRWLVMDARVAPRRFPPDPAAPGAAAVRFTAGPARPAVSLPLAGDRHRWELLLEPGDDPEALAARWWARDDLDLDRVAVYAHHARRAARWRHGRVLLLGDAAHVMPPFAGQGWGAGARDAADLAWKLAAVLRGQAPTALLDTYERERRPDVAAHTRVTQLLGAALLTRRPRVAAVRDAALATAAAAPVLGPWVLDDRARPGARALFPQPDVGGVPLDELVGPGWAVLGLGVEPPPGAAAPFAALGARVVRLPADVPALRAWRRWHGGADVVALRPDRRVVASAHARRAADRLPRALERLLAGARPDGP